MKISIGLILSLLSTLLIAQDKLVTVKVNDDISLKIPDSFTSMSDSERIDKYVSSKTPLAMFTSEDRTVDLGINTNIMAWIDGEEDKLRSFYRGTYETMFDQVEYIQDTVREINGRPVIVFEFIGLLEDKNAFSGKSSARYYSYIQYTAYNNQVLLFNFGCKPRALNKWQPIAREIMESIKVK